MKTDFQKWFFFQLKCLGKVLDALFMMIQDNKGLADFGSPCSLSTTNVKSKNQRPYGKPVLKVQCSKASSGILIDYNFFKIKENKDRTIKTLHDLACTK